MRILFFYKPLNNPIAAASPILQCERFKDLKFEFERANSLQINSDVLVSILWDRSIEVKYLVFLIEKKSFYDISVSKEQSERFNLIIS